MAITHLSTHTGKTQKIRAQETAPGATPTEDDPAPVTGDLYLKVTSGSSSSVLAIYNVNTWVYFAVTRA